jgi:DNA anti-recombination protein RmuC
VKGATVTITDTKRFELHQYLRTQMETDMADTLMDHLPPAGWSDLARTGDVSAVRIELKSEIQTVRAELKAEIAELRTELKGEIAELRTELKSEIAELRTELKSDIAELRAEMLDRFAAQTKWFLVFTLTNVASMAALVVAVILKA